MSKQQYESGTSFKMFEKKRNATEVNKVCHDFPLRLEGSDVSLSQPKRDKFSGLTRRAKRRKMAMEEDKTDQRAIGASIRSAKKSMRPAKIGMPELRPQKVKPKKNFRWTEEAESRHKNRGYTGEERRFYRTSWQATKEVAVV